MEDHGFFFDWLIVDVALREPRVFDPVNLQVCDPTRPTTIVSGGPGRRRWEFMCLPGETLDALDDEARAWELLAPWDVTPANATMVRHAGYRFQARWATRWHDGRVFLAGDAAHLTPPFAGQGMCAGLRDSVNLAWKLDHVLARPRRVGAARDVRRGAHPARRPGDPARDRARQGHLRARPGRGHARDEAMATAAADGGAVPAPALPPLSGRSVRRRGAVARCSCRVGSTLDGPARFDDDFGAGWRLVADGTSIVPADLADWFASIGGAVVAVGDGGVADADGTYRAWFDAHGTIAALQRPDFHVFGIASDSAGVAELLEELRRQITAPAIPR